DGIRVFHVTGVQTCALPISAQVLHDNRELWQPLELCYRSLHACGMGVIADGALLDTLRRVAAFGLFLVRLDIRQDAARHAAALGEITEYLGLGDYQTWDEQQIGRAHV